MSSMASNIPVIVINLKKDVERRRRMVVRLREFSDVFFLTPNYDERFDDFVEGIEDERTATLKCLFSHLDAYRHFLTTDSPNCLIMEDDALLHNDFFEKLDSCLENKPSQVKSILLSPYFIELLNTRRLCPENDDLFCMSVDTMGAACYYLERDFAQFVIDIYGIPLRNYPVPKRTNITSEYILSEMPGSYLYYPPLAIEDCLSSNIDPSNLTDKKKYWDYYCPENYQSIEIDKV